MADDTENQPLAVRARTRRDDRGAREAPADRKTERSDLQIAIDTVDSFLTGDTTKLPASTASSLSQWLEDTKYLGG